MIIDLRKSDTYKADYVIGHPPFLLGLDHLQGTLFLVRIISENNVRELTEHILSAKSN